MLHAWKEEGGRGVLHACQEKGELLEVRGLTSSAHSAGRLTSGPPLPPHLLIHQAVAYEYNTEFGKVLADRMYFFSHDPQADTINRLKVRASHRHQVQALLKLHGQPSFSGHISDHHQMNTPRTCSHARTRTHTHTHTHALTHTRTHTRTHTCTHTQTNKQTRTHAHTLLAFPHQDREAEPYCTYQGLGEGLGGGRACLSEAVCVGVLVPACQSLCGGGGLCLPVRGCVCGGACACLSEAVWDGWVYVYHEPGGGSVCLSGAEGGMLTTTPPGSCSAAYRWRCPR